MRKLPKGVVRAALAFAFSALLAGCGGKKEDGLPAACTGKSSSAIGGPFSLIDQNGRRVTEADFQGRPSLFYFGFTFCPDVCPLTLSNLKLVANELGPDAAKMSTVFVTVDAARDTPDALKAYLSNPAFPAGTIGLTGTPQEVKAALETFKVASQIEPNEEDESKYTVAHTSIIYLMTNGTKEEQERLPLEGKGPPWRMAAFFPDTTPPAEIATCVKAAIGGRL
ncbi:MAG: SCO family protein [Caulobacterales bacterium]